MDKILVIFCCYNRKRLSARAIRQLNDQYSHLKFLVVDDGSTDGTEKLLKKIKNVEIIHTKENCYYSASMRYGMEYIKKKKMKYDYLLLINDDVDFSCFLKDMISFSKQKKAVIVGSTLDHEGNLSYGGILQREKGTSNFQRVGKDYEEPVDTFNANCVLIPFEFFLNTPSMDRHYSHGMGDFDYGISLRKKGYLLYMYPEYVGVCDRNTIEGTFRDKNLSFWKRFHLKESKKGLPFYEYFYYNWKNFSFSTAVRMNYREYKNMLKK